MKHRESGVRVGGRQDYHARGTRDLSCEGERGRWMHGETIVYIVTYLPCYMTTLQDSSVLTSLL